MKKQNLFKKSGALLMAAALCIGSISYQPAKADAASNEPTILYASDSTVSLTAYSAVTVNFTITNENADTYCMNYFPEVTSYNLVIKNETETFFNDTIYTSDSYWSTASDGWAYNGAAFPNLPAGNYSMTISTFADTYSDFYVCQYASSAKLNYESLVVTKGFSNTLKVENGTVKSYKSSNSKVASVSNKGKVTGKKKGTATITATLSDGSTLTCKVTVKDNVYSRTKSTLSDYKYGEGGLYIYKMAYNKKGDLVLTGNFVNNCGHTVTRLDRYNYTIKNVSGKVIGKLSIKNKKVNIPNVYVKKFTFTIKKKNLKIKSTQDIRCAEIVPASNNSYSFTY